MMAAEPTAGPALRDIHVAAPPSWWPPAPGWWLLAASVLVLLGFIAHYAWKKYRRRVARRRLLAEFDLAVAAASSDAPRLAATLSTFLRRSHLRHSPRAVTLSGAAWLEHLDRETGGDAFANGVGRALIDAPYRRASEFDAGALIALVRSTLLVSFDGKARAHV